MTTKGSPREDGKRFADESLARIVRPSPQATDKTTSSHDVGSTMDRDGEHEHEYRVVEKKTPNGATVKIQCHSCKAVLPFAK